MADFKKKGAAGQQPRGSLLYYQRQASQSIGSAIKCRPGFIERDFRLQPVDLVRRDLGRIRHDHIESGVGT